MNKWDTSDIPTMMAHLGNEAKAAAVILATASSKIKNTALIASADTLRKTVESIKIENSKDMEKGRDKHLSEAMLDRLLLTDERIEAMASGVEAIAALPDPIGVEIARWKRPNGLDISRVRTPLGVIGIIYESRPNVTVDAGALCIKSGNAVILRGGSESYYSSRAILSCLQEGLRVAGLPVPSVQMIPVTDRAAVGAMLTMVDTIDVIIPRGGKSLIERVANESKIPLFKHLEGICHTYIHAAADPKKALEITFNAKMRRTGICGATETLLVDRSILNSHLPALFDKLIKAGCEIRGDKSIQALDNRVKLVYEQDWDTEYLDSILSVKAVEGVDNAIAHINAHSSGHTEAIITEDRRTAEIFLNRIDSAILMVNASTQFADGGEFGMGAEIGISTGKLHARGPVGVEQLTSFKYLVRGTGQVRP